MKHTRSFNPLRAWRCIATWFVIIVACFSVMVASARYKAPHSTVKRVTVTGGAANTFFSSNYLNTEGRENVFSVDEGYNDQSMIDVKICNTDILKPVEYYARTIRYDLVAELVKDDGTAYTDEELGTILGSTTIDLYRMVGGTQETSPIGQFGVSQISQTFLSESLTPPSGSLSAVKQYRIVFPQAAIGKGVRLKLTASPTPRSIYPDLPVSISGSFYVKKKTFNLNTTWTGAFNDNTSVNPAGYDGFNYCISGGGSATRTLSWNKDLFEPDWNQIHELFDYDINSIPAPSGSIQSISINLDSSSGGRYDLQFYVVSPSARSTIDTYDWTTMATLITLSGQ